MDWQMIDFSMLEADQVAYIEQAKNFWTLLKERGGAKKANLEARKSEKIGKRWADNGYAVEFFTPLLTHEAESVRYAGASGLLSHGNSEEAVNILEDIVKNSQTLVGSTAELFLKQLRKSKN
jgi:hypothetical protein